MGAPGDLALVCRTKPTPKGISMKKLLLTTAVCCALATAAPVFAFHAPQDKMQDQDKKDDMKKDEMKKDDMKDMKKDKKSKKMKKDKMDKKDDMKKDQPQS
jgi:pentapeptide MXKDX repeat protein